jgi:outer membrane protein OmpA-like peptidoglycan-associated protein
MKRFLIPLALGLASTSVMAANEYSVWNAGAAATFADYSFDDNSVDDSTVGLKLFGGYRINKWFGLEAAYHSFGDFSESPALPAPAVDVNLDGYSGSVLLYAPFNSEDIDVFAKAGYYNFDQELDLNNVQVDSNSPDGLLLGAGLIVNVSKQFAFRAEAEWFDIDDGELWAINLGAEYRFGRMPEAAAPVAAAVAVAAPVAVAAAPVVKDSDGDGVNDDADQCPDTPAGAKVDARGCEEQLILRGVNFDFDSAVLTGSDILILDSVADILTKRPNFNIEVRGHTDSRGNDDYNLGLSQRRADAVRDYLVEKGTPAERLTAVGLGEADPIADNDTEEGRALNRRVTLQFTEQAGE